MANQVTFVGTQGVAGPAGPGRTYCITMGDKTRDGTSPVETGEKLASVSFPINGTIKRWRMVSDVPTTATVNIWRASGARPTVANNITPSNPPALSNSVYATSNVLTGWNTGVNAGDLFVLNIVTNNNAKMISITLEVE